MGTSDYMSPEQASGEPASELSDEYSLACVLFELLTGRVPFPADNAVTAALPFLKCAESVEILCVSRSKDEPIDSVELKEYLALQGVSATERHVEAGTRAVGDVLLEEAIKSGAGLLVAGGYGHSRLRELFFSGVTSHVVSHAGMPLFLVH